MRRIITIVVSVGLFFSSMLIPGRQSQAKTTEQISSAKSSQSLVLKHANQIIEQDDSFIKTAWHTSHVSHYSHQSHRSHYSHYSG